MPSEGKPQPIDTAVIETPGDVPTTDLFLLADRRGRHAALIADANGEAGDFLAALALGTTMRRVLDGQERHLVREAQRHGVTWEQLAGALGGNPAQVRAAFERPAE
ncbi:hypothetical protein ACWF94_02785 [Streptomyces sp. NPDC055078]